MARTPLGPRKLVRERGSSSQSGLILAPGQEGFIGLSFLFSLT